MGRRAEVGDNLMCRPCRWPGSGLAIRLVLLLVVLSGISASQDQNQENEARAIDKAKGTSVRRIENSLPDQPFEKWLRGLVGKQAQIDWEVNDCGEQTGNPALDKGRDFPMCVSALVTLGKHKLDVQLSVGTFKTGVRAGPAGFFHGVLIGPNGSDLRVKSLSVLPEAIKAVR